MKTLEEELEQAYRDQEPSCGSCGWGNAWYELGEWEHVRTLPDGSREFNASCQSKDHDDCYSHRGYYIYLPKASE